MTDRTPVDVKDDLTAAQKILADAEAAVSDAKAKVAELKQEGRALLADFEAAFAEVEGEVKADVAKAETGIDGFVKRIESVFEGNKAPAEAPAIAPAEVVAISAAPAPAANVSADGEAVA